MIINNAEIVLLLAVPILVVFLIRRIIIDFFKEQ